MKPIIQRWYSVLEKYNDTVVVRAEGAFIGELCEIKINGKKSVNGEVTSFKDDLVHVSLLGDGSGISNTSLVAFTGDTYAVSVSPELLGSVIDAEFKIVGRLHDLPNDEQLYLSHKMPILNNNVSPFNRSSVDEVCHTGIKCIDAFLTVGIGQRVGIFAPAGCGKTTLMISLMRGIMADVYVIVLIGERGREVHDFITTHIPDQVRNKSIIVYSTSDQSSILRRNAALIGTTIAEYFRSIGMHVLLLFDSVTRYARALREIALDSGEVANDKFPASVYSSIPKILERSGKTKDGAITAFYTILLEGVDSDDVLGNEIKSILDGHFYLSQKLASKNHYPAIDVLESKSRLFTELVSHDHISKTGVLRSALDKYKELEFVLDIGEYKEGVNQENDKVVQNINDLNQFLVQQSNSTYSKSEIEELLDEIYRKFI
ncbi:MAG: FliI/YscN family ATPase [Enterovibrio sp.]